MKTNLIGEHVTIEADKIASGLLGMMDDDQRAMLSFGMLPAEIMEVLKKQLTEKFSALGTSDIDNPDLHYLWTEDGGIIEYSLKDVTSEASHMITIELYKIGDMVI